MLQMLDCMSRTPYTHLLLVYLGGVDEVITCELQQVWGAHLNLYLRVYLVWMWVSPAPPGLHLQLKSFVFRDQHVKLSGFFGGTDGKKKIRIPF